MAGTKLVRKYRYTTDIETFEFIVTFRVSTEFKFYFSTADIPEPIREHLSPRRLYAETFFELDSKITDLIEKYEASFVHETRVKIIAYFFDSDHVRHADGGHELRMGYRVLWEFQSGDEKKYLEERRRGVFDPVSEPFNDLRRGTKTQQMEWTAEREVWFQNVSKQIEVLSRQIKQGFGSTPTVLARKIDQNVKLLPGVSDE